MNLEEMASKGVITQRHKEDEGKPKNVQATERKNRRALGDIGNLVKAVDGKPQNPINRPMTRSLYAHLVTKGQPAVEKNIKKPLQEVENGGVGRKGACALEAAAVQRKVTNNQKPRTLEAAAVQKKESDNQKPRTLEAAAVQKKESDNQKPRTLEVGRKGVSALEAAAVQRKVTNNQKPRTLEAAAVQKKESDNQKPRTLEVGRKGASALEAAAVQRKVTNNQKPRTLEATAFQKKESDNQKPRTLEAAAVQKKDSDNQKPRTLEAAVVQKKESDNEKPKSLVMKSPKDEMKHRITGRRSRPESSKMAAKTLTSILSARSKAACGLVNKPKDDPISNIDASDVDNELAAVEYVDDIYTFYKLTEKDGQVHDYMTTQTDINSKMRAILIDWLVEVHRKFELMPESLYLTINIVDRYLSMKVVPRRELQLVGVSSMLIACKYEEIWAPEVNDFIAISSNAYSREQVLLMEKSILAKLEWYLTVPTPYVFLVRYIKSSVPSDCEMENMVFFLAELGLMHYSTTITYCPSLIAASAVYAARCTLKKSPSWTTTLEHYTGYSENQLRDCAKLLVSYHAAVPESKLMAVYKKFSVPEKRAVSLTQPGKVLTPVGKVF